MNWMRVGFLNFGAVKVLARYCFVLRPAQCTIGCSAVPVTSTYETPVEFPSPVTQSECLQAWPYVPWGVELPPLENCCEVTSTVNATMGFCLLS